MITCKFENGSNAQLRHMVTHVIALKENKILLVKRAEGILEAGKWGLPGGFADRNETIKQTAIREFKEETGWDCEVISLFKIISNPNRPNDSGRQNIALEFLVKPLKKTGESDWEQTEVKWWDLDEINESEMAFDHGTTINFLKKYLKGEVEIPIFA